MKQNAKALAWGLALALLAALLLAVNLGPSAPTAQGSAEGALLPDFSVSCLDGRDFSAGDCRGRTLVINLWATWCAPCVRELPAFAELQRSFPEELQVLLLHPGPVTEDVAAWLADHEISLPCALDPDGTLCDTLGGGQVLPRTLVISPQGEVLYNRPGSVDYEKLLNLTNLSNP